MARSGDAVLLLMPGLNGAEGGCRSGEGIWRRLGENLEAKRSLVATHCTGERQPSAISRLAGVDGEVS